MLVCLTPPPQAWEVKAGQLFRIVCVDGPQVADVNFWQLQNPKERFYASKTRQLHASHLKAHDRCAHTQRRCPKGHSWAMACRRAAGGSTCSVAAARWACPAPGVMLPHVPHLSCSFEPPSHRLWSCFPYMRPLATITHETIQYGIDKDGASVHDVIGSRCARSEPDSVTAAVACLHLTIGHAFSNAAGQ